MKYSLRFLHEVEEDLFVGYSWYEGKVLGLGEKFLQMFYNCTANLPQNALIYEKVYGDFRRCFLRKFPYAVYFQIEEHQVIVFGLFHCARDPRTIKSKLTSREIDKEIFKTEPLN